MPEEIIAIDYGTHKIGLARGNNIVKIPEPLKAFIYEAEPAIDELAEELIIAKPSLIVVGLPLNMRGEETPQTHLSREFAIRLVNKTGIEVVMQDESLSTVESDKWRMRYPDADEDSLAACIILERYFAEGETSK